MGSISIMCNVDDLLKERANETIQTPLVAYPRSEHGLTDFWLLTAKDLNDFTDRASMRLVSQGLRMIVSLFICVRGYF